MISRSILLDKDRSSLFPATTNLNVSCRWAEKPWLQRRGRAPERLGTDHAEDFQNLLQGFICGNVFPAILPGHIIRFPKRMTSSATFVAPRTTGTFCRMRWFLRYARGEARLCRRPNSRLLQR